MMNWKILRKTAVLAVGLMLWMTVAPSLPLNARQEDVLQKARRLIDDGEMESAIALLEGYVAKIRAVPEQKAKLAEAGYVLARAYYMVYQDQKSDDYLRLVFEAVPDYSVPETNRNFLARVEKIKGEPKARKAEEKQKPEAANEAAAQKKAEEAWKAAVEKKAAEDKKRAAEAVKTEAAKAEEKPQAIAGEPGEPPLVKKKGKFPWLIVGGLAVAGIVAAVLLSKKGGGKTTTTTSIAPTTGDISITSTPAGAKVALDGSDTGKTTPCTLAGISPGSHTLILELSNYGKWTGSVEVKAGQTASVNVTLAGYAYEYVLQWGMQGTGNGELWNPAGIAVDPSRNVFVADSGNYRIHKFDTEGTYIRRWGSNGTGDYQFRNALGIAVDKSGNVYVADTNNCRIMKYSGDGDYLAQYGSRGTGDLQFNNPTGIAVDSSGDLYVADTDNHRFIRLSWGGNFVAKGGGLGSGDGQYNHPSGIAVDSSGNIYVADTDNHRVQKLSPSGGFIMKWGSFGTGNGQFNSPTGIAVDSSKNVYVADSKNNRVQKFNENGVFMTQWGGAGSGNSQFNQTWGVALDSLGYVFVTDYSNHRVQRFRLTANAAGASVRYTPLGPGANSARRSTEASALRAPVSRPGIKTGKAGGEVIKRESRKEAAEGTIR